MKTLYTLLIATLATLVAPAHAAGEDLINCRWSNGSTIEPTLCSHMLRKRAEERSRAEADQAEQQRLADDDRARQADRAAQQAQADRQALDAAAAQAANQQTMAARLAEQRKLDEQAIAQAESQRAARRGECEGDFGRPRIGMSLDRARQCVGDFRLVSQLNRSDGVVSVYRAGRLVVHEMGGRIAAWSVY